LLNVDNIDWTATISPKLTIDCLKPNFKNLGKTKRIIVSVIVFYPH